MIKYLLCAFLAVLCLAPSVHAFDEDHMETINGTLLHFRVRGTDKSHPYLVLLHGGPGFSAQMFYKWGASLEKDVNVVYLDQRGSGQSARLKFVDPYRPTMAEIQGYTIDNLVADIEGVRAFLHVDKWYVLGHSWGGMLGLEYVTVHPNSVLGYIHMDGLVSVPAMQTAILDNAEAKLKADPKANASQLALVEQIRALPKGNPQGLFGAFALAQGPAGLYFAGDQAKQFPAFRDQVAEAVKPYNIPTESQTPANEPVLALMVNDAFLTRDDTPLLAKISVPTLVINGRQDGVVPPAQAEAVHAAIKGSQLLLLDNCGHFPFVEKPVIVTNAVLNFIHGRKYGLLVSREAGPSGDLAPPRFPKGVKMQTITAPCIISFTVGVDGHVDKVGVKQSCGNAEIDKACVQAIQDSKFLPAIQDHTPYAQRMEHIFTFSP